MGEHNSAHNAPEEVPSALEWLPSQPPLTWLHQAALAGRMSRPGFQNPLREVSKCAENLLLQTAILGTGWLQEACRNLNPPAQHH